MYKLFYGDELEALKDAIEDGLGYSKTAGHLWPHLKNETAYARLKACVNEAKPEKLSFGEVIALCKFNGRFDPLMHFCDEVSHDRPAMRAPADKQAELMQAFAAAVEQSKAIAAQLERLVTK